MKPEVGIAIICAGFVGFFVLLFGTLLLMRWFRHKERLAMIQQGLLPADAARPRNGKGALVWGIGITAFGLALSLGLLPFSFLRATNGVYRGVFLLPGLLVLFMGVALLIIYFATRPTPAGEPPAGTPLPVELDETPELPVVEDTTESHTTLK
jgi:sugar phosphate permease